MTISHVLIQDMKNVTVSRKYLCRNAEILDARGEK